MTFSRNASCGDGRERQGTVLIVSLIVLSSIMISSSGISALIINSLQQTTALDRAAVAYYAAETAVERTVWEIRRGDLLETPLPESVPESAAVRLPNGSFWSRTVSGSDPEISLSVPAYGFVELEISDPASVLGSLEGWSLERGGTGLDHLEVSWEWDPSSPCDEFGDCPVLFAEWLRWSPIGLDFDPFDISLPGILSFTRRYLPGAPARIPPLGEAGFPDSLSVPDYAYRVRLRAEYSDLRNVIVRAYDRFGNQTEIPGRARVEAVGRFGNTYQKIAVSVPRKVPLSPLFTYAVFSECSLVKGFAVSCP